MPVGTFYTWLKCRREGKYKAEGRFIPLSVEPVAKTIVSASIPVFASISSAELTVQLHEFVSPEYILSLLNKTPGLMIPSAKNYFVDPDCIDGRKSFNGLTGIIRSELQRDPAGGDVFIFVSRSRQSIKLLFWEHGGFVIYYKRMDNGSFEVPPLRADGKGRHILKFNCSRCCAVSNFRKKNNVKEQVKPH